MTVTTDEAFAGRAAVPAPVRFAGRAAVEEPKERTGPIRAQLTGDFGVHQVTVDLGQTIVIPTFNERDNIATLLERLAAVLPTDSEIIFVDDSTDDTPEVIRAAAADCPIPVVVHHRDDGVGGLGGAVVEGMRLARGAWIVVMDADLQHPPEVIPDLIAAGIRDGADLVIGTRYRGGGNRDGLSDGYRRLVSGGFTVATKTVFRNSLLQVSDPMSGLFAVRESSLQVQELQPLGYKILLELVIRNRPGRIVEVPYSFQQRHAGESKSSMAEGIRFLKHMAILRVGAKRARVLAFGVIGASGLIPNQLALWLLAGVAGVHYLPAAVLANLVAVGWNFALTDTLLYRNRRHRSLAGRITRFFVLGNADLLLRIPLLALLVGELHIGVLIANLLTLIASFVLRFLILDKIIYRTRPAAAAPVNVDVVVDSVEAGPVNVDPELVNVDGPLINVEAEVDDMDAGPVTVDGPLVNVEAEVDEMDAGPVNVDDPLDDVDDVDDVRERAEADRGAGAESPADAAAKAEAAA